MTHIADLAPVSCSTFHGPSTLRLRVIGALLMTLAVICVVRAAVLIVAGPSTDCVGMCGCGPAQQRPDSVRPAVVACLKPRTYR
jgi:hypothetical protein